MPTKFPNTVVQCAGFSNPTPKRDVDNLLGALAEKLLRKIDSLLKDDLMGRQRGAEFEPFGEMRLAHLRHPGQRADGQRLVEVLPDVLDTAR